MLKTKQIKPMLQRLFKNTDTTMMDSIGTDVIDSAAGMIARGANILTVMIASAFASLLAYYLMSGPGGLVGLIGRFLASLALQSGQYDFDVLLTAFAMSQILLIGILIAFALSLIEEDDWEMEYIEDRFETLLHDVDEIRNTIERQADYDDMLDSFVADYANENSADMYRIDKAINVLVGYAEQAKAQPKRAGQGKSHAPK